MYKKEITYRDFNDVERTETFYFNLSKMEIMKMEFGHEEEGGFSGYLQRISQAQDRKSLFETFQEIILMAYGEKSEDGKRFVKSKELSEAFSQTNAFSELYMELATDTDAAVEFVNGIMPRVEMSPDAVAAETKKLQ